MINRSASNVPAGSVFTKTERQLLDRLTPDHAEPSTKGLLSSYIIKVARLGGYLARSNDPPPGNIVMWRGLARLTDIKLGFAIGSKLVGN